MVRSTPPGPFALIVADPPWNFRVWSEKGRGRCPTYPTLDFPALCALPVRQVAAKDAVLALWVTSPILLHRLPGHPAPVLTELLDAWGFAYSTVLFTWIKQTVLPVEPYQKKVFADGRGLHTGNGYSSRANGEYVLLARRGRGLPRGRKDVHSVVVAPVGRHSVKPEAVQDRLEALYGDVARLELFARRSRPGWTTLGLDVTGNDIRDDLRVFVPAAPAAAGGLVQLPLPLDPAA